jgi:DNA-binding IclR family transcriptional regulator
MTESSSRNPNTVQVFGKMVTLLEVLADSPAPLGLTQVATRAGIHKASAHRMLTTLLAHDFVEEGSQPGTYRLGLRLFQFGSVVQSRLDLRTRALPFMQALADETEETIFLSILRRRQALCIERIEGKHVQVLALQVGTSLPLFVGGGPRVLLASLPDAEIAEMLADGIEPMTRFTQTSPEQIWQTVLRIRQTGYAISDEDVTIGVAAVGAPVRGVSGEVLGALSVSGITQRLTRERIPTLIEQVVETAEQISRRMGYAPERPQPAAEWSSPEPVSALASEAPTGTAG